LLSFGAESFDFQFAIYKYKDQGMETCNFVCFLYGCEVLSLTLREKHRLRVSENRVLRRIVGSKRDEEVRERKYFIMRSLMICSSHQALFG